MTKLIINTISSEKITPNKQMGKGGFVFTAGYIDRDDQGPNYKWLTWESKRVHNPTEGDMAKQAQKFLTETDNYHPYLEGYDIDREKKTIHMGFGS